MVLNVFRRLRGATTCILADQKADRKRMTEVHCHV